MRSNLKWFYLGLLFICSASVLLAQNAARREAVFPVFLRSETNLTPNSPPIFAILDVFQTELEVINPNSLTSNVTLQVFDSAGQEVLPTQGVSSLNLKGNTVGKLSQFRFLNKAFIGWVKLTSEQPVVVQQIIEHRIEKNEPGPPELTIVSRISKSPSVATRQGIVRVRFSFGDQIWSNTGISIVYPTASVASAKGTLVLRSGGDGAKVGEAEIVLSPNGQLVNLFTEWFPNLRSQFPTSFAGTLEFSFNQDVFVAAIQANILASKEELVEPNSGSLTSP